MSPSHSGRTVLETVSRRRNVLERLEEGPDRKRNLVESLDSSRSTIDRAMRELERLSLVERADGGYRLTATGRLALAEHRRSLESLDAIAGVSDLLENVPPEAPMSVDALRGATVHEPEPHAPNEPLEAIAASLETADRFRGFAAAERGPRFRELLYERTVDGDLDAEILLTDDLVAFLLENRPEVVRDVVVRGGLDVYSLPSIPYGLGIVETPSSSRAFVVVYDGAADVRAVIRNDSPTALEWANDVYRRFRAMATRLEPPEQPR